MSVSHHIGLEIAERCFRLVEMKQQDRQSTILRADTWETEYDFSSHLLHDVPFERDLAKSFISSLSALINSDAMFSDEVSLILPVELPVITTLPVDRSLSHKEQAEQLQWETRTLAGFPASTEMHILSHRVGRTPDVDHTLVVALPQATVDFIVTTFSFLTLDLTSVDVDHFILEDWVRHAYQHTEQAGFGVLGMYDRFCTAGAYARGEYLGFRMHGVDGRQKYLPQALQAVERLRLNEEQHLDSLYVFGPRAGAGTADALHSLSGLPVGRIIPLVDTEVPSQVRATLDIHGEHVFDACAGAALRGCR